MTNRNPLETYFDQHTSGPGIWKWRHYFDIYHRHFERFRGREVHILEIGVYSGGSLGMWRHYFGSQAHIYGVDLEPGCVAYESERIRVFTGDQGDRSFWRTFRAQVPMLDIVVDDGSHVAEHQKVSMEELLPHLNGDGVYLCEDVHGCGNEFAAYVYQFADQLNAHEAIQANVDDPENRLFISTTDVQAHISGVHMYPYAVVIEKRPNPVQRFVAPKHGTEWQPFLK